MPAVHLRITVPRRRALMKPQALIVNTARGEVIDENALVRALRAGAGLGAFEHGPPVASDLRVVVLPPHRASAIAKGWVETRDAMPSNTNTFAAAPRPPDLAVPVPA